MLNESGFLLMADGRCPDEVWKAGSMALQTEGQALLDACKKKDRRYSYRYFSQRLGSKSPSFVNAILEGKLDYVELANDFTNNKRADISQVKV